jgi:hypothetical protein
MEALSLTGSPFKISRKGDFVTSLSPSCDDAGGSDAAALFQQLQMLRNENRMRWGEAESRKETADVLKDFKATSSNDNEERVENMMSAKRSPLKTLTNKRGDDQTKKSGSTKKNKQNRMDQTAVNGSPVRPLGYNQHQEQQQNVDQQQLTKKQNHYRTSKLSIGVTGTQNHMQNESSIGIAASTYEVNNYGVDHSLLFNFTFPIKDKESENNFYEESPTNSTLSWSSSSRLSAIEEGDEVESENGSVVSEYLQFDTVISRGVSSPDKSVQTRSLQRALGPLLSSTSSDQNQVVFPDYYADDAWKDEEQLCHTGSCSFFTSLANLFFKGGNNQQNCFMDGCEL